MQNQKGVAMSKQRKRAIRIRGLTRKQHAFLREKVLGMNDKEAALAAGYSLSVAENTKQKLWAKPEMRSTFERLRESLLTNLTNLCESSCHVAFVQGVRDQNGIRCDKLAQPSAS
jgi:hypothetical protein